MAIASRAANARIPRDKPGADLQTAVAAFLSQPALSAQTRRSYRLTLAALTAALDAAGADPTAAAIEAAARLRWGTVAPATWNRHAATVRSFLRYAARHGLVPEQHVELDRRREPADRTRALPKAALERLFNRRDIPLRDKTLWRLLYETAARANEALCLNVEDLDIPNRRAVIRGKNGELDYLHWQTASGHLLSRLIAGRSAGPVFLTDRRASPGRAPAAGDLCPQTGRARLSYRRAQELFAAASGGWTLHQLRHSALTHLAEENVSLALLMAKSRHTSLRSLQKYAAPASTPSPSSPPTTTPPGADADSPRPAERAFADSDLANHCHSTVHSQVLSVTEIAALLSPRFQWLWSSALSVAAARGWP